ncbi:MAG: hypothetical protein LKI94_04855 [Sporolactobacillus sp.]|jgi:DNA-directed RNA polymerase subunit RPC12/RpoP|nr:hypothetical protein [Sporolactobacillus sp.]
MAFWTNFKERYIFRCSDCGREIKPGEFMSIIATAPQESRYGMTEVIINRYVKVSGGKIYCRHCFERRFTNH